MKNRPMFNKPQKTERETYAKNGCEEIWDYLAKYLNILPSWEGFSYTYRRRSYASTPEQHAEELVRRLS